MWSRRKKEDISAEDAELRALVHAYSQLHGKKDHSLLKSIKSTAANKSSPQRVSHSTQQSSMDPLPELPMDDVIRGSSFSYTRAEAKIYANEEPCDTWRHFDVVPIFPSILIARNGSTITYHYMLVLITTVTERDDHPSRIGRNFVFVSVRKV